MRHFLAIFILGAFFISPYSSLAQKHNCGQHEATEQLYIQQPELRESANQLKRDLEKEIETILSNQSNKERSSHYVIPVVFHIIHENGYENITNSQIWNAIKVLNADYSASNDDLSDVIPLFQSRIGDANCEFRLARRDPQGNPTDGIDRIYSNETNTGDDGSKLNPWPRGKYLNIWVSRVITSGSGNNASAYAYLPSDAHNMPTVDGIICNATYVGSIGVSDEQNQHTLSHEVGHFLNLYHTWGTTNSAGLIGNCSDDDAVNDTPNTIGTLGSCNLNESTCGVQANVQNIMDYATCDRMFTSGQVNRMHATLQSNVAQRNSLVSSASNADAGVTTLWEADFSATRISACQFEEVQFYNESKYGANSFQWTFPGGDISTSTDENPSVRFEFPGINNTSLEASNGSETKSVTIPYVLVMPLVGTPMPYFENLQSTTTIPNDDWVAYNPDKDEYGFELSKEYGYNDQSCIKMYNVNNLQFSTDELISTTFDLSVYTGASFNFRYAYKRRTSTDNDKLTVYFSNDCGQTWSPRWSKSGADLATVSGFIGSEYRPASSNEWAAATVTGIVGTLISEKTQVKFVFEGGQGNTLWLDEFSFDGTWTKQAQLRFPRDLDQAQPNDVELNWKDIDGADAYEYQIDVTDAFNSGSLITGQNSFTSLDPDDGDTRYQTNGLTNGETYYWRVRIIQGGVPQAWSETWSFTVSANGVSVNELKKAEHKFKVYPNPASTDQIATSFFLRDAGRVSLSVVDMQGREIRILDQKNLSSGGHHYDLTQLNLENGVYIVALKIGEHTLLQRFIIR